MTGKVRDSTEAVEVRGSAAAQWNSRYRRWWPRQGARAQRTVRSIGAGLVGRTHKLLVGVGLKDALTVIAVVVVTLVLGVAGNLVMAHWIGLLTALVAVIGLLMMVTHCPPAAGAPDLKRGLRRFWRGAGMAMVLIGAVGMGWLYVRVQMGAGRVENVLASIVGGVGRIEKKQDEALAKLDVVARLLRESDAGKRVGDPIDAPPSADALKLANEVRITVTVSRLDRLRAAIVLARESRDFSTADAIITELDRDPAIREGFDFLTLQGDRWYYVGEFDKAIEPYEAAWRLKQSDFTARTNLALALQQSRAADPRTHLRRAVELHKGTLTLVPALSSEWAATQNNLGAALLRQGSSSEAVQAYMAALTVYTRKTLPQEWIATQTNLANTLWDQHPVEEPEQVRVLGEAVEAYRAALTVVRTRESLRQGLAVTDQSPVIALCDQALATEGTDRKWRLLQAGRASREALNVYALAERPEDWEHSGPNGEMLMLRVDVLKPEWSAWTRVVDDLEEMLNVDIVPSPRTALEDWAMTQNDLANALSHQAAASQGAERARLLGEAVEAHRAALEVYTRAALPQKWAATQNNLALALVALADVTIAARCPFLRQAISCGKAALSVYTREHFPLQHAGTSENLVKYRRAYEEAGCAGEIPFDAIEAAE